MERMESACRAWARLPWAVSVLWGLLTYAFACSLVMAFAAGQGPNTLPWSITIRFVTVCWCAAAVAAVTSLGRKPARLRGITLPLVVFLALYYLRILYDTLTGHYPMMAHPLEYQLFFIGGCLIPMLAAAFPLSRSMNRHAFRGMLATLLLPCLYVFITCFEYLGTEGYRQLAKGSDGLLIKGMTIANWGGALAIVCMAKVFTERRKPFLALYAVGLAIGVAVGLLGETRSVVLSFIVVYLFLLVFAKTKGKLWRTAIVACCIAWMALFSIGGEGVFLPKRCKKVSVDPDKNTRMVLWNRAIEGIRAHPWIGYRLEVVSVEDETHHGYPHNNVLEAFLATGVLGGGLFVFLCIRGGLNCIMLLRRDPAKGWIAVLFIRAGIQGFFSGSLYYIPMFWIMLAALEANTAHVRRRRKNRRLAEKAMA
jgi:O-antigen ligase